MKISAVSRGIQKKKKKNKKKKKKKKVNEKIAGAPNSVEKLSGGDRCCKP